MTQKELNKLKEVAESLGEWAVYLLMETEYWTPMALDELTEEELQSFQESQSQWLMENERNYPPSGAKEMLRADTTEMIKSREDCLTADEASEMEMQRMDGMTLEELPQRLKKFRVEQEKDAYESRIEWKLMNDYILTKEETDYMHRLPKEHLLQKLLRIDESY